MTPTAEALPAVAQAASTAPSLLTIIGLAITHALTGLVSWFAAKGRITLPTRQQVDQVAADTEAAAPLAQAVLTMAGQPGPAALLGQVAAVAEQVNASHAQLQAAPSSQVAASTHAAQVQALQATTNLVQAVATAATPVVPPALAK